MSESCTVTWEMPLTVIEDLLGTEFELANEIEITSIEYDEDAQAIYIIFTADSRDSERIPESSIFGYHID